MRKVAPDGTITVVAGTGDPGYGGDGGPATAAQLFQPTSAVPTADGGFLIAELGNCLVRKVDASGKIQRVAGVAPSGGTPSCGNATAGGQATQTQLYQPTSAVPFSDGSYLIGSLGAPSGTPPIAPFWPASSLRVSLCARRAARRPVRSVRSGPALARSRPGRLRWLGSESERVQPQSVGVPRRVQRPNCLGCRHPRRKVIKPTGTRISFRLSRAGRVRFTVLGSAAGRLQGKGRAARCHPSSRRNHKARKCTLVLTLGKLHGLRACRVRPSALQRTDQWSEAGKGSYTLVAVASAPAAAGTAVAVASG